MQDLSMYCLDIATNSVKAKASVIKISMINSEKDNLLSLMIEDNGCGMDAKTLQKVVDPFYTTRTTRRVGLGVSFFKNLADMCEGEFNITSTVNVGTHIKVTLKKNHWDTPPIGNLSETVSTLIQMDDTIQWIFEYSSDDGVFVLDTNKIKDILDGVSLKEPKILIWIKEYVDEQLTLI